MRDMTPIRRAVVDASDDALAALVGEVQRALAGDSNDAEHDALVNVADLLGIRAAECKASA